MKTPSLFHQPLLSLLISGIFSFGWQFSAQAAARSWDGGPSGTGTSLLLGENWTDDTVPGSGDSAVWNNLVSGNLALTFNATVGGSNGMDVVMQAAQTGNVSITNNSGIGQVFRIHNITVAAGAGSWSIGQSGSTINFALGSGSLTSHTWTNNSDNTVLIGSNAELANGGAIVQNLAIMGSGDWNIQASIVNAIAGGSATNITKSGEGILTLSGNNTTAKAWTGNATINAGTLLVTGSSSNATFQVNGGVLAGTGSVGNTTVQAGGVLRAGNGGIGTLATKTLSFLGTSTFDLDINTTAVSADLVNVVGNLNIASTAALALQDLGGDESLGLGTTFTVISYSGEWNGVAFDGYADDSIFTFGVNQFRISYNGLDDLSNAVVLTVVPEPGSLLLLGLGGGFLALLRRRARTLSERGQ